MRGELREIQRTVGITTVFVTHDQTEALGLSDRIAVMNRGRIEQLAAPREVYERPATRFVADFVGASSVLRGRAIAPDRIKLAAGSGLRVDAVPVPVGAPVELVIRPEPVSVADPARGRATDEPHAAAGRLHRAAMSHTRPR